MIVCNRIKKSCPKVILFRISFLECTLFGRTGLSVQLSYLNVIEVPMLTILVTTVLFKLTAICVRKTWSAFTMLIIDNNKDKKNKWIPLWCESLWSPYNKRVRGQGNGYLSTFRKTMFKYSHVFIWIFIGKNYDDKNKHDWFFPWGRYHLDPFNKRNLYLNCHVKRIWAEKYLYPVLF